MILTLLFVATLCPFLSEATFAGLFKRNIDLEAGQTYKLKTDWKFGDPPRVFSDAYLFTSPEGTKVKGTCKHKFDNIPIHPDNCEKQFVRVASLEWPSFERCEGTGEFEVESKENKVQIEVFHLGTKKVYVECNLRVE